MSYKSEKTNKWYIKKIADDSMFAHSDEYPETFSNLEDIKNVLRKSSFAKIEDGDNVKYKFYENHLAEIFDIKIGNYPVIDSEKQGLEKNNITFFALTENEVEKLAKEITEILNENKEEITKMDKELNELKKSLESQGKLYETKEYENARDNTYYKKVDLIFDNIEKITDNTKPIKFDKELKDKVTDFTKSIDNINAIATLFRFDNKNDTEFFGNIIQKDGEKEFNFKFVDLKGENEKTFKADNILNLKDKIVDFIKENEKDKEVLDLLNTISSEKINDLNIETDNNFRFDFSKILRNRHIFNNYSLKIEDEQSFSKAEVTNTDYSKLAFALVDKDTSRLFEKINEFDIEKTYKDEYFKEMNKNIVPRLDNLVKEQTLTDFKRGMYDKVYYRDDYAFNKNYSYSDFWDITKEKFDENFKSRVENLKDKEEFLVKNADEFGLTLTNDNRILELNSFDETEYQDNINSFIKGFKENLYENLINDLQSKIDEELGTKPYFVYDDEKKEIFLKHREDIGLRQGLFSHFHNYEENLIENLVALSFTDENIKTGNYTKKEIVDTVMQNKDICETITLNEDKVYNILSNLDTSKYERFSLQKIELEKDKEKNTDKEVEITKQEVQEIEV